MSLLQTLLYSVLFSDLIHLVSYYCGMKNGLLIMIHRDDSPAFDFEETLTSGWDIQSPMMGQRAHGQQYILKISQAFLEV